MMSVSPRYPLHRFEEFGRLSHSELDAVTQLGGPPTKIARGQSVRGEGEPVSGFFLLFEGWVLASALLPSGSRQGLKVHLPGDVLGTPSMSSDHALETLTAITPAIVSSVALTAFSALVEAHPRIATRFLLSVQRERAALMDQLTSMGRTSAEARVAAFLVDLAERLGPLHLVRDEEFHLPLTQEQIGDVVGLTGVHVNRTLRHLEDDKLISRTGRRLRIAAPAKLMALAARPFRPPRTQLDWLPAGR